jgi:hypothetical protein
MSTTANSLGSGRVRLWGTVAGVAAFCVFSRTWQDWWHVAYDLPAALAVYSFVAQVLAEGLDGQVDRWWRARALSIVAMTVITAGRALGWWPISGHVCTVLAVGLIQVAENRLRWAWRAAYWLPLPVLVVIRVLAFDKGFAAPLWLAVLSGASIGLVTLTTGSPYLRPIGK